MKSLFFERETRIEQATNKLEIFNFLGGFDNIITDSVKVDFDSKTFCLVDKKRDSGIVFKASDEDFNNLKNVLNNFSIEELISAYNRKMLKEKEENDEFRIESGIVSRRGRKK